MFALTNMNKTFVIVIRVARHHLNVHADPVARAAGKQAKIVVVILAAYYRFWRVFLLPLFKRGH